MCVYQRKTTPLAAATEERFSPCAETFTFLLLKRIICERYLFNVNRAQSGNTDVPMNRQNKHPRGRPLREGSEEAIAVALKVSWSFITKALGPQVIFCPSLSLVKRPLMPDILSSPDIYTHLCWLRRYILGRRFACFYITSSKIYMYIYL